MAKRRFDDWATAVFCASLVVLFFFAGIFRIGVSSAEEENRTLAELPRFSVKELISGEFFEDISLFVGDNFPLRKNLVGLNAKLRILLGERESNGVFLCSDGSLIMRGEYESLSCFEENIRAIGELESRYDNTVTVVIPRACDVYTEKLPQGYITERAEEIYGLLARELPSAYGNNRELLDALREAEEAFYATDHHWTTEGAYSAYKTICTLLEIECYGEEYFTKEIVSRDFYGSLSSKAALYPQAPDVITLYRYSGDTEVEVLGETGESMGLYDWKALDKKDKYQVFLSGNRAFTSIRCGGVERPRLLMIKDSFANSIVPFLALHFDIDMIDPRYCDRSVSSITEGGKYDRVLILFGADTLATTPVSRYLS